MKKDNLIDFYSKYYYELKELEWPNLIPIKSESKIPVFPTNLKTPLTEHVIESLINSSKKKFYGIAIKHIYTSAFDLDYPDEKLGDQRLKELIGLLTNIEKTPPIIRKSKNGYYQILFRHIAPTLKKVSFKDPLNTSCKIEILGNTDFTILYGIHPKTKKEYEYITEHTPLTTNFNELPLLDEYTLFECTKKLLDFPEIKLYSKRNTNKPLMIPDSRIIELLDNLDPDCEYEEWIRIGMALHHHYSGNEIGKALFTKWSEKGSKSKPGEADYKWGSFTHQSPGITLNTLFYLNRKKIKEDWEDMNSLEVKTEDKTSITSRIPEWVSDWVYLTVDQLFYHISTGIIQKKESYDAEFRKEAYLLGSKYSPSYLAIHEFGIRKAKFASYNPQEELLYKEDQILYLNTYVAPKKIPLEKDKENAWNAIQKIIDHTKMLFPVEEEHTILLDWIAFNTQNPGKRIMWAPLIQGNQEGGGKTFFIELMRLLLGRKNVFQGNIATLQDSKYSTWAHGHALTCFDEIFMPGSPHKQLVEVLKPYLTGLYINVHDKYESEREIKNVTNYLFLTNHIDTIALTRGSRRYFALSDVFKTSYSLEKFNKENPTYYDELFATIKQFPGSIIDHFKKRKISSLFNENKPAYETEFKRMIVDIGEETHILDCLLNGLYDNNLKELAPITIVSHAQQLLTNKNLTVSLRKIGGYLSKIGYSLPPEKIGSRQIVNNQRVRIWVNEEFKKLLCCLGIEEAKVLIKKETIKLCKNNAIF